MQRVNSSSYFKLGERPSRFWHTSTCKNPFADLIYAAFFGSAIRVNIVEEQCWRPRWNPSVLRWMLMSCLQLCSMWDSFHLWLNESHWHHGFATHRCNMAVIIYLCPAIPSLRCWRRGRSLWGWHWKLGTKTKHDLQVLIRLQDTLLFYYSARTPGVIIGWAQHLSLWKHFCAYFVSWIWFISLLIAVFCKT